METETITKKGVHKTLTLGKIAYDRPNRRTNLAELELRLQWRDGEKQTIDLEPISGYWSLSICGGIWNSRKTDYNTCGQCIDTIAEYFPRIERVQRIKQIWERWHLSDMKSGTREQTATVEKWLADSGAKYDYTEVCNMLQSRNQFEDHGYKYGNSWLVEPVPDEIIREVCALFEVESPI